MIIAIPQLNYKAGDIQGNSEKIISAIQKAQNQKAELILFPELAVSGALPQDLLAVSYTHLTLPTKLEV